MHEVAVVRDLLDAAESAAGGETIRSMRLTVGALSGVDPSHLARAVGVEATRRWGAEPRVDVEVTEAERGVFDVRLAAVGV